MFSLSQFLSACLSLKKSTWTDWRVWFEGLVQFCFILISTRTFPVCRNLFYWDLNEYRERLLYNQWLSQRRKSNYWSIWPPYHKCILFGEVDNISVFHGSFWKKFGMFGQLLKSDLHIWKSRLMISLPEPQDLPVVVVLVKARRLWVMCWWAMSLTLSKWSKVLFLQNI